MRTVAIVDYGAGNLGSVARAVARAGARPLVTADPKDLETADRIILPGVGAFGDGMAQLRARGLADALTEQALGARIPVLGLCLGMQLMAAVGEEHGRHEGLGWIPGRVTRIVPGPGERVPHVGWNQLEHDGSHPLFRTIPSGADFYFVHSFHVVPDDPAHAIGRTPFAGGLVTAIGRDNIVGVQWHPEKSQRVGQQLIANFLSL